MDNSFNMVLDKAIGLFAKCRVTYDLEKSQPEVTWSKPEVAMFELFSRKST